MELRGFWCGTQGCVEPRAFWCGTQGCVEPRGVLNRELFGVELRVCRTEGFLAWN